MDHTVCISIGSLLQLLNFCDVCSLNDKFLIYFQDLVKCVFALWSPVADLRDQLTFLFKNVLIFRLKKIQVDMVLIIPKVSKLCSNLLRKIWRNMNGRFCRQDSIFKWGTYLYMSLFPFILYLSVEFFDSWLLYIFYTRGLFLYA